MPNDKELGLETLLAVNVELEIDLENELLSACFKIQKKYQFSSHDRTLSTTAMDKLIETYVEKVISLPEGDEE